MLLTLFKQTIVVLVVALVVPPNAVVRGYIILNGCNNGGHKTKRGKWGERVREREKKNQSEFWRIRESVCVGCNSMENRRSNPTQDLVLHGCNKPKPSYYYKRQQQYMLGEQSKPARRTKTRHGPQINSHDWTKKIVGATHLLTIDGIPKAASDIVNSQTTAAAAGSR